jgi:pimeloyl-ACP methyl ester carboxylesterase
MKKLLTVFCVLSQLLQCGVVFAEDDVRPMCDTEKVTVVYVNGIFSSGKKQVKVDAGNLEETFLNNSVDQEGKFIFLPGYNPSHLSGLGDLLKATEQSYVGTNIDSDIDLATLADDLYEHVHTEKILLVGHSQGTFYTNALYEHFKKRGGWLKSIGVYNIATPASFVAAQGRYLTSSTDNAVAYIRSTQAAHGALLALPANASLPVTEDEKADLAGGHDFSKNYLANAPAHITRDILAAANKLENVDPIFKTSVCFPPQRDMTQLSLGRIVLAVGDVFMGTTVGVLSFATHITTMFLASVTTALSSATAANSFSPLVVLLGNANAPTPEALALVPVPVPPPPPVVQVRPTPVTVPTVRAPLDSTTEDTLEVTHEPTALFPDRVATPPTSPSTNPGNLSSLTFGSGAGGGGASVAEAVAIPQPETPPTVAAPTCTTSEVLDVPTNTCTPRPVTCTTPETRTETNTCTLPPHTGPTLLPNEFTVNTTLSYTSSPYISKPEGAQTITIPAGVTVTVEAGVLLQLALATHIVVQGTLLIQGTPLYPVTLTSAYDDTTTLAPRTHPWTGISVMPSGTLAASYTTLSYGGWMPRTTLPLDWPRATIHSLGSLALDHTNILFSQGAGIIHSGTSFTSTSLTVDTADTGLDIRTPLYSVTDTNISHTNTAVSLDTLLGKITGTTGTSNSQNSIVFGPQTVPLGATAHLYPNTLSYFTTSSHSILGTLLVHPNTFVQNVQNTYTGTGSIVVPLEAGTPPVFSSLYDSVLQGETRGTAVPTTNTQPTKGDWGGVSVGSVEGGLEVRYGGN